MKSLSLLLRAVGTAALFVSFASCTENLDSSAVCKVLCPAVGGEIQNITLDAVVLDTSSLDAEQVFQRALDEIRTMLEGPAAPLAKPTPP